MKEVIFDFGRKSFPIQVPQYAEILKMGTPTKIKEPEYEIRQALRAPINSPPLQQIVKTKLSAVPNANAVIVISDNTRPVPYSGKSGILFPLVTELIKAGLSVSQISILVATGTHHSMSEKALRERHQNNQSRLQRQSISYMYWRNGVRREDIFKPFIY